MILTFETSHPAPAAYAIALRVLGQHVEVTSTGARTSTFTLRGHYHPGEILHLREALTDGGHTLNVTARVDR